MPPDASHPLRFLWGAGPGVVSSWSLHGESLLCIWNMLKVQKPRSIVELGSGLSTLMFARYTQSIEEADEQSVIVHSIEHEQEWAEKTREMLREAGLEQFVTVHTVPIIEQSIDGFEGQMMDLSPIQGEQFEFALIDSPPAYIGRRLSLPLLQPLLKTNAVVILDDAQRLDEQSMVNEWLAEMPNDLSFQSYQIVGNGLCIMRFRSLDRISA